MVEAKQPETQSSETEKVWGKGHFRKWVEQKAAEYKEDVARWKRDHPLREPGTSLKTWKSYSRVRYASEAFRRGYDQIDWRS